MKARSRRVGSLASQAIARHALGDSTGSFKTRICPAPWFQTRTPGRNRPCLITEEHRRRSTQQPVRRFATVTSPTMSSTCNLDKNDPIIILGAGAWGLSTALHLLYQGYSNISVFERAEQIPSIYSAAYDLNKIVRAEYEDGFYTELALNAIKSWKQSPIFSPHFHQTGYVVCTTKSAPEKATTHLEEALKSVAEHPIFKPHISRLSSADDFRDIAWQFTGPLGGFTGYFNRLAGYAHSADAMKGCWEYLAAKGVRFVLGDQKGKVTKLVYSSSTSSQRTCTGITTADGLTHPAKKVIVALGAWAGSLIPDVGHSVVARCWSVAHVQLAKSECDYLRFIPTTNVRDLGFFFEPDPETRLFKLCPLGAGYTNTTTIADPSAPSSQQTTLSLPPASKFPPPQDFIPVEDERKLRRLLQEIFPWMADRPFVEKRLCWFADTRDSEYCIDFVPDTGNSVVVLTGDSGHGFKMMPVFGEWVVELLERNEQKEQRWRWRPKREEKAEKWGDEVSWRIGRSRELEELVREKEKLDRARL